MAVCMSRAAVYMCMCEELSEQTFVCMQNVYENGLYRIRNEHTNCIESHENTCIHDVRENIESDEECIKMRGLYTYTTRRFA